MKINHEWGLFNLFCVCVGKTNWALIVTAARLAQLEERRSADEPKSLKNWWDHASCETPFSVQMIASLGVGLVCFILVLQLEGDVKEPVTLFEKSRGRRPWCHGLSDLSRHWSGWARCDQTMDWSGCKSAPLHADVRPHLSGSSAIHRMFFVLFCFVFFFKLFSLGEFELCYVALPCLWEESNVKTEKNRKTRMMNKMGSWCNAIIEDLFDEMNFSL